MSNTKSLKQIQEENRKLIILANNPEAKSYEEALEMEEKQVIQNSLFASGNTIIKEYIVPNNFFVGLGKPLTLEKILLSLSVEIGITNNCGGEACNSKYIEIYKILTLNDSRHLSFKWDLTKPTLEEQTEETQRAINKLLSNG